MSRAQYPTVAYVRECLRYEDGKLFWLVRPLKHFATETAWKVWNKRYSTKEAGRLCKSINRVIACVKYSSILIYHIVWAIHNGKWEKQIDHRDLNSLNDRIDNLRPCTNSQNMANSRTRSDNTSGYKCVSWDARKKKWVSQAHMSGKCIHLGYFDNPKDAHAAYVKFARRTFGEFAHDGDQPILPITDSSSSMSKSNLS